MNTKQVEALYALMQRAKPPRKSWASDGEPDAELHVSLSVASGADDGNTYEAKLWTVEVGYRFPDEFYLCSDGSVYLWVDEAAVPLGAMVWCYPPQGSITHTLESGAAVASV